MLDYCRVNDGAAPAIVIHADMAKSIWGVMSFFEEKVKMGHLGLKTSKGIYDYGGHSESEGLKTGSAFSEKDRLFEKDQCLRAGVKDRFPRD
jgi:3-hydroxyacyl-CoA dehydrogenase